MKSLHDVFFKEGCIAVTGKVERLTLLQKVRLLFCGWCASLYLWYLKKRYLK